MISEKAGGRVSGLAFDAVLSCGKLEPSINNKTVFQRGGRRRSSTAEVIVLSPFEDGGPLF